MVIQAGAKCKRDGCKVVFREGLERGEEECVYHFGVVSFLGLWRGFGG